MNWQDEATRAHPPVAELIETIEGKGERFGFGYLEGVRDAMKEALNKPLRGGEPVSSGGAS